MADANKGVKLPQGATPEGQGKLGGAQPKGGDSKGNAKGIGAKTASWPDKAHGTLKSPRI